MNGRVRGIFILILAVISIMGCASTKTPPIEHPFYKDLIDIEKNVVLVYRRIVQEWSAPMYTERKFIPSHCLPRAVDENVWKLLSLMINGVDQPQTVELRIADQTVEVEIIGSRTIEGQIEATLFDVTAVEESLPFKLIHFHMTYWWNTEQIDDFSSVWAPSEIHAVYTVQRKNEGQPVVERNLYEEWQLDRILPVHEVVVTQ
jgi:hypothetical protein